MDLWVTLIAPVLVGICSCFLGDIWNCLKDNACCYGNLKGNLVRLKNALEELKSRRVTVEKEVEDGRINAEEPLPKVINWISQVEALESDTNKLIARASGQDASSQVVSSNDASAADPSLSTSRCCFNDNFSNCCLAGKVSKKVTEVENLTKIGNDFNVVTKKVPPAVVKKITIDQTFGLDTTLEKIWTSLMEDENRILGIYGMGGIGKTTLLAQINNKFFDVQDDFGVVIWVKVFKIHTGRYQNGVEEIDVDFKKIQDTIGERLGLCNETWLEYSREKKADKINSVLTSKEKGFAILLDDLWKDESITKIGIPIQAGKKKTKIVFTTRYQDVCARMRANQDIEVKCLEEKYALELLQRHARCSNLHGRMLEHAKEIVNRCGLLPLAIEVIGQCLSSRTTADEWYDVFHTLDSSPYILKGMKDKVFGVLKVSYDGLEEDAKLCFLYCALFPMAHNIRRDKLVEYWICEGILGAKEERETAKNRGVEIIYTLVGASLLLKDESTQKVSMHDMIREAALWMVSVFRDGERFVVKTNAGLVQLPHLEDWTTVTKMSVMKNEIKSIPDNPQFPNPASLQTLFLQDNKLDNIVGRLFQVMSTLVVLDLSENLGITELSEGISELVSLRFLNLKGTSLKYLPNGLSVLTQLIHLNIESTSNLRDISLISKLWKLQVLRFCDSRAPLDLSLLKDLERLVGLELLTITVRAEDVLEAFLGSNLAGKTHGLFLEEFQVSRASFAAIARLGSLHKLEMVKCRITDSGIGWKSKRIDQSSPSTSSSEINPSNTWFKNLSAVKIISCIHLKDLTWLMYAENLESLKVESSPKMEDIISKEKAVGINVEPFLNLRVLRLDCLDALKSIYWSPLSFPRLHKVRIKKCPELRKLPFNSTSVEKINDLRMKVGKEWLERVEWDDEAGHRFLPFILVASEV